MTQDQTVIAPDWYQLSFDSLYSIIYAHRDVEAAEQEARFSIERAQITDQDIVLDLCCGNGRHIAHLQTVAGRVVGLDYSPHMLQKAREILGSSACLVRADMRNQPFDGVFDVVANYFTSFGYFQTREENLAVIEGTARALKPGGRFFIDYINLNWAKAHVEPRSVRFQEEFEIRETRWIDEENQRVNKTTQVLRNGEPISESGESVQLYTLDEMTALLKKGGLILDRTYGDYAGTDCCDPSKPRMILIGHKG